MRRHLALMMLIIALLAAACSTAVDLEAVSTSASPVTEPSVASSTPAPSTLAPATTESSPPDSVADALAFDDTEEAGEVVMQVFPSVEPTDPTAPSCIAAEVLLSDPSFRDLDSRSRELALIEATSDLLGGADEAWLAIRDETLDQDDFDERVAEMTTAFDLGNQLNRITWETCGIPILQVDTLLSRTCIPSFGCDEPLIWAQTVPCFEMERLILEIGPDVSFDNELYAVVDCDSNERLELDRDGMWRPFRTAEEWAQITTAWVVEGEIAAGTSSAEALENGQLVQAEINQDLYDPLQIVEPRFELDGLTAARDLPDGHILVAGDFLVP